MRGRLVQERKQTEEEVQDATPKGGGCRMQERKQMEEEVGV